MSENNSTIFGEPLGPRVVEVLPTADYCLRLAFDNGEQRFFDAKPLLSLPAFKPLQNKEFFTAVKVELGTVVWPQDIDYCPDTLYNESVPQKI